MFNFVFSVVFLGDELQLLRMCETLPPTLAGPIEVTSFLLFLLCRENGGDKRDNLNWQMAFLNREKVISQIFEVGQSAKEPM